MQAGVDEEVVADGAAEQGVAGRPAAPVRGSRSAPRSDRADPPGGHPAPGFSASLPRRSATSSAGRSEEHTSELQSLMRISYAVFCLKKKKKHKIKTYTIILHNIPTHIT